VETAEARKQRQATLRDQWVQASSMENKTPPTGTPKAACAYVLSASMPYTRLPGCYVSSGKVLALANADML